MKLLKSIILIGILVILAYQANLHRNEVGDFVMMAKRLLFPPAPCTEPIKYSIKSLDERFGLSRQELLHDLAIAENVWESVAKRNLFQFVDLGGVEVNFIYDYRQQATEKLKSLGYAIDNDMASYDALKYRYDKLVSEYNAEKSRVATLKSQFETEMEKLNKEIDAWNKKGGAPKEVYSTLRERESQLKLLQSNLNQAIANLNNMVDTMNSMASVLNRMAKSLNLNVKTYNTVGASTGPEFDEGQFVRDSSGERIDIYQYADNDALVRVLAHEFGHALDLDHVNDENAVMYKINKGKSLLPTAADVSELLRICPVLTKR